MNTSVGRARRSDRLSDLIDAIDIQRHGDLDDVVLDDDFADALDLADIHTSGDFDQWLDEAVSVWSETTIDPLSYTSFETFEADGSAASIAREDLHDQWKDAYALSSSEKDVFGASNHKLLDAIDAWIDSLVQHYFDAIDAKTRKYKKKKWKLTAADLDDQWNAIDALEDLRRSLGLALRAGASHGADLMILAGVVWNEARGANDTAKLAVAYAYLNFTHGSVVEPTATFISDYLPLPKRWKALKSAKHPDVERLAFLQGLVPSIVAATARLDDPDPTSDDKAKGADHWVSPRNLKAYSGQANRYERTVGSAVDRAFPDWARDPSDPAVADMKKTGALLSSYNELRIDGVNETDFLFYTGVK